MSDSQHGPWYEPVEWPDEAGEQTIAVRLEDLRILFDLAVNSLDHGSGFWDREDTEAGRRIAVLLGVDPMLATPTSHAATNYPHASRPNYPGANYCGKCEELAVHPIHDESAR